ncbi:response regulator transcription factor [Telmatocola sphagniphila]|jgi:DNA-binding NarL/FixJ family response regulator|uniref:Response regulator transcription factor n=1 Tax=Telmatocola sphagniphila TaxID=1123043 RepID=A0A8E6EUU5_9BACT|nr:response regulator transcription factor [Telmatocola sphagniphila]QVL34114.1 response regulator transcription factor [Telmatocola sphagniphila]
MIRANKLRIFLADDHAVVREGLKALINAQSTMQVVGEASNGIEACQLVLTLKPDVVVMDVSMPGLSGSQATSRLRQECATIRVLALTVHEDKGYIRQLLAAGAAGYVLKRAAPEELIHAIRAVAAGGVYLDPIMASKVVGGFVRKPVGENSQSMELSDRETEVAKRTAAGYSNKEIAARLELSIKTVETYRSRAMDKLGLHSRADLVRYAVQQGWLQNG